MVECAPRLLLDISAFVSLSSVESTVKLRSPIPAAPLLAKVVETVCPTNLFRVDTNASV